MPPDGISAAQFQAVNLAVSRHEKLLKNGARGGFFLGDGGCIKWLLACYMLQQLTIGANHSILAVRAVAIHLLQHHSHWSAVMSCVVIACKQHPTCTIDGTAATGQNDGGALLSIVALCCCFCRAWCWQGPADLCHYPALLLPGQDQGEAQNTQTICKSE